MKMPRNGKGPVDIPIVRITSTERSTLDGGWVDAIGFYLVVIFSLDFTGLYLFLTVNPGVPFLHVLGYTFASGQVRSRSRGPLAGGLTQLSV